MHVCTYVWKYGLTNPKKKQSFEGNMYTTWDASLQDLCGCIPWGT
jgi:hypothetical protein